MIAHFGEDWGNIKISHLEIYQRPDFKIRTDGMYIIVNHIKRDIKCKYKCSNCCCYNGVELIEYITSGGLHLGFGALILSDSTDISYSLQSLADE